LIEKHVKSFVSEVKTKSLKPSGTGAGKLYGTCKVHKAGYPVRPIVSMINTPEYNLAKYLDTVIKPCIPDTYSITSNVEFIKKLKEFDHQHGDYCISFDIVSLFTNVPLQLTLDLISDELYNTVRMEKPPMPKQSFLELLRAATGGIFSHRDQLFQQSDGVSMGNPLAPTLANFFLGYLERNLFSESEEQYNSPKMYIRYVDDIFCIFRKDADYKPFLSKLNGLHPNLAFTYEMGGDTLPFLDTKITLNGTNEFSSTVFRKQTDSGVILNYSSNSPMRWKTALINWFLNRAARICSDSQLLSAEIQHLRNQFYENGYPYWMFDKVHKEFQKRHLGNNCNKRNPDMVCGDNERGIQENDDKGNEDLESDGKRKNNLESDGNELGDSENDVKGNDVGEDGDKGNDDLEDGEKGLNDLEEKGKDDDDLESGSKGHSDVTKKDDERGEQENGEGSSDERPIKIYLKVPFIGKRSIMYGKSIQKLVRTVIENDIITVYTSSKVQEHFVIKDKTPKPTLSKVVYQFQCPGDPEIKYVGFTNRTLNERVREHLKPGTAVFDHISECQSCQEHGITINDFRILKTCRSKADTAIYEALLIKKLNPVLNHNLKKPGWTWSLQVFG
jgi:hypothetical protein